MKMKIALVAIAISGLVAYGWYSTFVQKTVYASEVEAYVEAGNSYLDKGYYVEAVESYKKAENEKENEDVEEIISYCYYMLEDDENCMKWADKAYENGKKTEYIYQAKAEYEEKMGNKKEACKLINEAKGEGIESENLDAMYKRIKSAYIDMYTSYKNVSEFNCENAMVWEEENSYVVNLEGKKTLSSDVSGIYDVSEDDCNKEIWNGEEKIYSGIDKNGARKYYDKNGYMRVSPEGNYGYVGSPRDGKILVKKGETWGYLDKDFSEIVVDYEDATSFTNGVAAVKKDGRWTIVDTDLAQIGSATYEDILIDEYKRCSVASVIFVKTGDTYSLVSTDGKEILTGIEQAKPFLSEDGYAAVKISGTWKLIDKTGAIIYEGDSSEINSTNCNIFGYKSGDAWGYKFLDGSICIDPIFQEVKAFNEKGYAFVKENDAWSLIELEVFE